MHDTPYQDGKCPWYERHGYDFAGVRLPFGSLASYMPKPETVKALPKFDPRGARGIIVGCRLHSGGVWSKDYLVFPVSYFDEYDYDRPRNLLELVPITTQEMKPVAGDVIFPLKAMYDKHRCFPKLPACMITPAEPSDCDEFEDKGDSEDADP